MNLHRTQPELYIHVSREYELAELLRSKSRERIIKIASGAFALRFGTEDIGFEVTFEEGSLKTHLKVTTSGLLKLVIAYGAFRSGTSYISHDIRDAFDAAKPAVLEVIRVRSEQIIRVERRPGVLGELDWVLKCYESGQIDRDELQRRSRDLISEFADETSGRELQAALTEYYRKHADNARFMRQAFQKYVNEQERRELPRTPNKGESPTALPPGRRPEIENASSEEDEGKRKRSK